METAISYTNADINQIAFLKNQYFDVVEKTVFVILILPIGAIKYVTIVSASK
jgi:hypothetical protein